MTSAGSRIEKIAKNKLLISAVIAVGVIAALFYSVPAYAFWVGNGQSSVTWVNGTRDVTLTVPIVKSSLDVIQNVSAKIMINGSTAGGSLGSSFVYATNCSSSMYFDQSAGYGSSGYGVVTSGYNVGTIAQTYSIAQGYGYLYGYGYGYGYFGQMDSNASAPLYCTFKFRQLEYNTVYPGAYIYVNGYLLDQAVSFTPNIYMADFGAIFGSVRTALALQNVTTNIDSCASTANACTSLYFNKTIATNKSIGANVTFTGTLDLTSAATVAFLQNLGTNMNTSQGMVKINASDAATFAAAGTQITLIGLPNYVGTVPSLTVTYDNGTVTTNPTEVSGLTYNGAAGTLRFTASHLSKYQTTVPYLASSATVNLTDADSQVVINAGTPAFVVTVPSNAVSAVLNASAYLNTNSTMSNATINVSVIATSTSALLGGTVNVSFPANITVYGPATWNGQIDLPVIQPTTSVTVPADSGYNTTAYAVVEVGFGDTQLNFSKAVRILLPGMAGKSAAYKRGSTVTRITANCTGDSQTDGDGLGAGADCKINSSSDLVIWTKHFTSFIAYYQNSTAGVPGSSSYITTTTVTPTPTPTTTVSATPEAGASATPGVSTTPVQPGGTPTPGAGAATPTITASIVPTAQPGILGAAGGDSTILIVVVALVIIVAAAWFFSQKK